MKEKFKEIVQQVAPTAVATIGDILYEVEYEEGFTFHFRYVVAPRERIFRFTVFKDGRRITLSEVNLKDENCAEMVACVVEAYYQKLLN